MTDDRRLRPVIAPSRALRRGVVAAVALAAVLMAAPAARAGDAEDCNGAGNVRPGVAPPPAERIEAACTALLADAALAPRDRAKFLLNRAGSYQLRGKLDQALADADAAVQLDERFVPALIKRGDVRVRLNQLDLAEKDLVQATEIEPQNALTYLALGNLRNAQKDWNRAITAFDQALALRQDLYLARANRGRALVELGQVDKAMTDLDAAVAINAGGSYGFYWRGEANRRRGDVDHAIEDFTRAIAVGGGKEWASLGARGGVYRAKGDYDRALADFDAALAIAPNDPWLRSQRTATLALQTEMAKAKAPAATPAAAASSGKPAAPSAKPAAQVAAAAPAAPAAVTPQSLTIQAQQLFTQHKAAEALPIINRALALEPMNGPATRLRVQIYLSLGQASAALSDLDGLMMAYPGDAGLISGRALLLAEMGHPDQALDDLARVQGGGRSRPEFYLARGAAYLRSGRHAEAVTDLTRATELQPTGSLGFSLRGQAYMLSGDTDKSLADLDHALTLSPADDNARAWRGLVLVTKGQTVEGETDINRVLERSPNNRIAGIGRCMALIASRQFERAIPLLSEMIARPVGDDSLLRMLRARALNERGRQNEALADLDRVLLAKPDDPDALMLRGVVRTALKDYDNALSDLNGALSHRESVEAHFVRAKVYEQKKDLAHAIADLRRATELPPHAVFDVVAQTEARLRVEQLKRQDKKVPCGDGSSDGTCL